MAKLEATTVGTMRGGVGNLIVYQWNGIWCARQKPARVRNPRTAEQQAHRSAFRAGVKLAASMREVVSESLLQAARAQRMTAYNLFMKLNRERIAVEGDEVVVDWPTLQLTAGPLPGIRITAAERTADGELTVRFVSEVSTIDQLPADADLTRWMPQGMLRPSQHDHVQVYAYSPSLGTGELSAPAWRSDGALLLRLPPDLQEASDLQLYGFARDTEGNYSPTTYGGVVEKATAEAEGVEEAEAAKTVATETVSEVETMVEADIDEANIEHLDGRLEPRRGSLSISPHKPKAQCGV